jgi:hypothetical protein
MPSPIIRQKFNLDEALGAIPPTPPEVELPKTPNYWGESETNWDSPVEQFELGLHNAEADTLSSMITDKMARGPSYLRVSDMLLLMDKQYSFILALVSKLLKAFKKGGK